MRAPYTLEELRARFPTMKTDLKRAQEETESQIDTARPLPMMTIEECQEMFFSLMQLASERPLTNEECFIHGQVVANHEMAARATALGKVGRWWALHESGLVEILENLKTR